MIENWPIDNNQLMLQTCSVVFIEIDATFYVKYIIILHKYITAV